MAKIRRSFCVACGVLLALAAQPGGLGAHAAEFDRIGHFTTADGEVGFVLDLSGETPRQRFDGSPEILLLKPVAAPRGDTIYRVSNGDVVLRGTPFGALTLFSEGHETGLPLVRVGSAGPLLPQDRSLADIAALSVGLEHHLVLAYQLTMPVAIPSPERLAQQAGLNTLGDAIENTGLALDRVAAKSGGVSDLGKTVAGIKFDFAKARAVDVKSRTLIVQVAPSMELAGRPSSYDIEDRVQTAIAQAKATAQGLAAQSSASKLQDQHSFDFQW